MSSTIYNPFLYAWLNENFRREFKQILPCFNSATQLATRSRRCLSERTCNGNETVQESYVPTSSQAGQAHMMAGISGFKTQSVAVLNLSKKRPALNQQSLSTSKTHL